MNNTRILFTILTLNKGGTENQLIKLLGNLASKGYLVDIFVFQHQLETQNKELIIQAKNISNNIYFGNLKYKSSKLSKIIALIHIFANIFTLCIKNKYNVVHSFLPLANIITSISAKLAFTKKIITSRRALNTHQNRIKGWKYIDKLTTKLSHFVCCNADMVKQDTIDKEGYSTKYIVIKNIISEPIKPKQTDLNVLNSSLKDNKETFLFLTISNLIKYKGHEHLLKAAHLLKNKTEKFKIVLIGEDRGIEKQLKSLADKLNISNHILWLGQLNNIQPYLYVANAYVSPSLEEGMSNSIMEAIAVGLPIIATQVGGTPELLENGKFGQLVPAKDPVKLANAMYDAIQGNNPVSQITVKDTQDFMHKYSKEQITKEYLKTYGLEP